MQPVWTLLPIAVIATLVLWMGREVWGWPRAAMRWGLVIAWGAVAAAWGHWALFSYELIVFLIVLLIATLGLLAYWGGVFPTRSLMLLLVIPAVLSIWLIFLPNLWVGLALVNLVILLVALADAFTLSRQAAFAAERSVGLIASLNKTHPVHLTVVNRHGRGQPVRIRDGVPDGLAAEPDEFLISLTPESSTTLRYDLRPARRGEFKLEHVHLSVRSRMGFWQRMLRVPCTSRVNVYPDMKQLGEYAVLARTNRLSLMGLRRTRRIGSDNEFERLRDYALDDNYKHLDWRATARRRKLTVKDFQANQSQRIVFLVDCGRMMTGEAAGVSLLDHALNSALLLSFVALRQHDQVGLMCFSDEVHSFLPPRGGKEQMNRILHACYNQFPRMVESRYDQAFEKLAANVRKRALVILISNIVDEVNAHQVSRHLRTLSGKHLPMGVLLRDHALFDPIDAVENEFAHAAKESVSSSGGAANPFQPDATTSGAFTSLTDDKLFHAAAAADILLWRRRVLANLEASGVLLVDTFPEDLTAPLVNRYMEIKARHLL
ncbi:MAG: DUF58 domain-containing protein [Planctomycetales bacterium]|nr:DUF58 domain-containing protein [Planctomycetales bacterium]